MSFSACACRTPEFRARGVCPGDPRRSGVTWASMKMQSVGIDVLNSSSDGRRREKILAPGNPWHFKQDYLSS